MLSAGRPRRRVPVPAWPAFSAGRRGPFWWGGGVPGGRGGRRRLGGGVGVGFAGEEHLKAVVAAHLLAALLIGELESLLTLRAADLNRHWQASWCGTGRRESRARREVRWLYSSITDDGGAEVNRVAVK